MAGHDHAHGAHDAHGHGHDDPAGDKRAAFLGMGVGAVLLGAFMYGMVLFTNARYAGHEAGEKPAAAEATATPAAK